jgi:hypothetical protein
LEGFGMENVATFYAHLKNIKVIWHFLWSFGNLVAVWYIFRRFWYIVSSKIWQPCARSWSDSSFRFQSKCYRIFPRQGDQIRRIFARWAIIYFGQFFLKNIQVAQKVWLFFRR